MVDPVALAQALIRCPSVTPKDEGALGVMEDALKPLGFACQRLAFQEPGTEQVENLYAQIGTGAPLLCFAGHTDVVPPGEGWRHDPFGAVIDGGMLYGRGAADMKSAIAAFLAAVARHQEKHPGKGAIALLITGDEEGEAVNGTTKVLDWLGEKHIKLDHCIVGEPSSIAAVGDHIKIGRRGSLNLRATVEGTQGHVAYPAKALNPIPALAELVTKLSGLVLDEGTEHFEASTLAFTSVDVGNPAVNVIPGAARAMLNIRFNDRHEPDELVRLVESVAADVAMDTACTIEVESSLTGLAFVTKPGPFTDLIAHAIRNATGRKPEYSTGGGTSDARFIKDHCPVAELGLVNATMHKVDECAAVADIHALTDIYAALLDAYFDHPPS
ncbi:MAG TPA: succinyl-diaminopimelate desuccinylase [Rhizomicrobium sp.]|nr:succinyl-diaminopimelate desuccinylase [Rhizomicrobium sp.]